MKPIIVFVLALFSIAGACSLESDISNEPEITEEDQQALSEPEEESSTKYWQMEAEDCIEGESYDEDEKVCFIECDTEQQCDALAETIYGDLDGFFVEDFEQPAHSHTGIGEPIDEEGTIAIYQVDSSLEIDSTTGEEVAPEHQQIWTFISRILPRQNLSDEVTEFRVFSDGPDETLAYVAQTEEDFSKWLIAIDIEDSQSLISSENPSPDFVHTVVHEFGHIIALENDQVDPDFDFEADSCPTLELSEGCPTSQSYFALFYQEFWSDLAAEIPAEDDEEAVYEFYDRYSDRFVSEYAATNPVEDLAESFAAYILQKPATGSSIVDEKIMFFSKFEKLETMRSSIRSQLARR